MDEGRLIVQKDIYNAEIANGAPPPVAEYDICFNFQERYG
jgi:hypothetical protein